MDFDRNDSNSIVAIRSELAGPLSTIQALISAKTTAQVFNKVARFAAKSFAPANDNVYALVA